VALVETLVEDAHKAITIPRNVGAALRELLTAQFEAPYRQHSQERDQAQCFRPECGEIDRR
jgi:hypothetical protein